MNKTDFQIIRNRAMMRDPIQFTVPTPIEIKAYLDTVMISQDEAKMRVAIEVYKHMLKIVNAKKLMEEGEEISKNNILITGLTGTGKTFMMQAIGHFLQVPVFIQDATNMTEAGYVGEDVENAVKGLILEADYDVDLAEQGIIVLDEIDKLGRKGENMSTTADVGHEGVQQAMLTMLEGTIVTVPEGKRRNPQEDGTQVDTSNILFIGIGSFEGIEDIVSKRLNKKKGGSSIGFGATIQSKKDELSVKELRRNITRQDLTKFGMMPELLGRFSVLTNLDPLDKEDLLSILKLNKSIFHEYKLIFELMGKTLTIKEEVYNYIVDKAIEEGTGARGLKAIIEDIMVKIMFTAPSERKKRFVLDMKVIEDKVA